MIENGPTLLKPKGAAKGVDLSTVSIAAGATGYSESWDVVDLSSFSLEYQIACTGTPNVQLQLQQSSDNSNWYIPDNLADINPSVTVKTLRGVQLSPITMRYLRIKLIELTGTVTDTVVTLKLSVQKRFAA